MTGQEHARHTAALSRLVLSGWRGTPVGDPTEPAALVYVHERGGVSDAVVVQGCDEAVATREVLGRTVRAVDGPAAEVVHEVLSW
ncbi:hypothetical protein DI005_29485 [Prauserella sp. PE36]|uniref:hypothetical protein n=1 Tax=Prauserella sp. PE36 TaxID=1504709 RepID=UPI000DE2BE7E|nr:hypothetical protein [Prauserella sp. PE36]RBM14807.1 hypothetical protein DI005_29485 [Prauserella sp. PE36]